MSDMAIYRQLRRMLDISRSPLALCT